MNAHHRTLPSIAGGSSIVMIAAFLTAGADLPWRDAVSGLQSEHRTAAYKTSSVEQPTATPQQAAAVDFSDAAFHDLNACAIRRLGEYEPLTGSFGGTNEWSSDWQLYWIDVEQDGNVIRIYHATDVRHPSRRFTAIWNGDHAEWERAY